MSNYVTFSGKLSKLTFKKYIDSTNFSFVLNGVFPYTDWETETKEYKPIKLYCRYRTIDYAGPVPKEGSLYEIRGFLTPSGDTGICVYGTQLNELDSHGNIKR